MQGWWILWCFDHSTRRCCVVMVPVLFFEIVPEVELCRKKRHTSGWQCWWSSKKTKSWIWIKTDLRPKDWCTTWNMLWSSSVERTLASSISHEVNPSRMMLNDSSVLSHPWRLNSLAWKSDHTLKKVFSIYCFYCGPPQLATDHCSCCSAASII